MNDENKTKTLEVDSTHYETKYTTKFLKRKPFQRKDPKLITAFIPGAIKIIYTSDGMQLKEGDKLLILEAMKMENTVFSPASCRVKKIHIKAGERVSKGQLLIELE